MRIPAAGQTVYLVDDDARVRESTETLLSSLNYPSRCYADPYEFLDKESPDIRGCLILDVRMPGMSGLSLRDTMLERGFSLPVIFVTGHADIPMAVDAFRGGAYEFLEKPYRPDDLLKVINEALQEDLRRHEAEQRKNMAVDSMAKLGEQERQVLIAVVDGVPNREIADRLGLSERRIEQIRSQAMKILNVSDVPALVQLMSDAKAIV